MQAFDKKGLSMITTCMSQIDALAVDTDDKWLYNSTQEESAPAAPIQA